MSPAIKKTPNPLHALKRWRIQLDGDWTADETDRILAIFDRLDAIPTSEEGAQSLADVLTDRRPTHLFHSGRPGRVGYTAGSRIYLDADWTDWTFAHELGHKVNNDQGRRLQRQMQRFVHAGRGEWIKAPLRRFLKSLEKWLGKTCNFTGRLDWRALWYDPGQSPPPCGLDRNFNASEDFAEAFAALVFPEQAKQRAQKASKRKAKGAHKWDWGQTNDQFTKTPRGHFLTSIHLDAE